MKKVALWVVTALFLVGLSIPSFAAKSSGKHKAEMKYDRIIAEVVSLDVAAKSMVVTVEKTGESRTISISAKAASELKVGDRVRIKLKPGTNDSAGVRVIRALPKAEPAPVTEPATEAMPAPEKK